MVQELETLYKLIVLYMLDRVNVGISHAQLSSFMLEKEYTNFITLQQVLSDLRETELIKSETMSTRTYFTITEEGRKTLSYFINRIGEAIKDDVDSFLAENNLELKNEASVTAAYYRTTFGDYETALVIKERGMEAVNIKLHVPFEDMAQNICEKWNQKNEQIYKYLVEELF